CSATTRYKRVSVAVAVAVAVPNSMKAAVDLVIFNLSYFKIKWSAISKFHYLLVATSLRSNSALAVICTEDLAPDFQLVSPFYFGQAKNAMRSSQIKSLMAYWPDQICRNFSTNPMR